MEKNCILYSDKYGEFTYLFNKIIKVIEVTFLGNIKLPIYMKEFVFMWQYNRERI
jgi:hypothetical protein